MGKSDFLKYPTGRIAKGEFCSDCGRYNSRNVVGQAMTVREGKVLMIKRGIEPMKGWWALPGGYLEWDESLEEGVLRELREETGLVGRAPKLVGVYSDPRRDVDGGQNVRVVYLVEAEGEAGALEEVEEVGWFGPDRLPDNIAFDHRRMIEDCRERFL